MPTKTTTILRGQRTYALNFDMGLIGKRKRTYFQTESKVDDALETAAPNLTPAVAV